jgi:hypothetical protein
MPIALQREHDNVFRVEIRGTLAKAEFDQCAKVLARELHHYAAIRLLFVLIQFEGWERHAGWRDLSFYVTHGDAIERIAIVGDERWRGETLMFASADLRRAPVEFFSDNDLDAARAWLAA